MIEKITLKYGFEHLYDKYFAGDKINVIVNHKQTEVSFGSQYDINLDYCKENNIPVYNLERDGGCIVYSKGNISFADVRRNDNKEFYLINIKFLEDFTCYLKAKGINATQDNNDILIDGYKVASGGAINLPPDYKKTFATVQISINQDIEAIKNICTKPMVKIPKGLSEYGITTEEVEQFVIEWFNNK